ncbi:hypothetical protein K488DRAFT_70778 [Vararia minispora EC-137]|uniref:Uncharacterized protein n=1 Tax=Vararia minispora EC-137 TaxID=1314806 RepID=A0ACB8QLK7_9AGAM|nr:hypothetical protein K488DRAFT_70778 [Vararia minispora EC-137]
MFPITCNAVGDIVAIAQLLLNAHAALSEARGSHKDFRDLSDELQYFSDVLSATAGVVRESEDEALRSNVLEQVQKGCDVINTMAQRIIKFTPLGESLSSDVDFGERLRRGLLKLEWRFSAAQSDAKECRLKLANCRGQILLALNV